MFKRVFFFKFRFEVIFYQIRERISLSQKYFPPGLIKCVMSFRKEQISSIMSISEESWWRGTANNVKHDSNCPKIKKYCLIKESLHEWT